MSELAKSGLIKLKFKNIIQDQDLPFFDLKKLTFSTTSEANIYACSKVCLSNDDCCDTENKIIKAWKTAERVHYKQNLLGSYDIISGTITYVESEEVTSYWSFYIEISGKNFALHIVEHDYDEKGGTRRGPASSTGTVST